jgi:hypothetical protein
VEAHGLLLVEVQVEEVQALVEEDLVEDQKLLLVEEIQVEPHRLLLAEVQVEEVQALVEEDLVEDCRLLLVEVQDCVVESY